MNVSGVPVSPNSEGIVFGVSRLVEAEAGSIDTISQQIVVAHCGNIGEQSCDEGVNGGSHGCHQIQRELLAIHDAGRAGGRDWEACNRVDFATSGVVGENSLARRGGQNRSVLGILLGNTEKLIVAPDE